VVDEAKGGGVAAHLTTSDAAEPPSLVDLQVRFQDAGLQPRSFSNATNDRYDWHEHDQHKILFCVRGAITFHTRDGDLLLEPGDRIDIEPGTPHAAHVHPPDGVTCIEAFTPGPDLLPR
jgi:quercetin dioxygenase-like cupin family protein